jgi:hypothetical protein
MAKDSSFYFSHDYNARNDAKIKKLLRTHGMLGYGIFWAIVEDLYNNANALHLDYESIAFDLRADYEVVKSVISDFELFEVKDVIFASTSVQRRLDQRNNKSIKARESANKRWKAEEINANALQTESEPNAIKERKGKEIKERKEKEEENNLPGPEFNNIQNFNGLVRRGLTPPPSTPADVILPDKKFKASDFPEGISDSQIQKLVNAVKIVKSKEISASDVRQLWDLFLETELCKKTYAGKEAVFSHFFNYVKKQPFSKDTKMGKKEESNLRPFTGEIRGLKFSEDFTFCEMEDGSIVKLEGNKRDLAESRMISPKDIIKK